jgi:putative Mg2+ transporter-C (MgtC) family protein
MALGGWDVLLRLAIAAGLGAAVGLERELRDQEAGMRTHLLVALGSCLFTIVGAYGFRGFASHGNVDPTRVAAQVVTGVGFLGAGAILRQGLTVRGLTTAGSLWTAAAIGMAGGAGAYWPAVVGTGLTLFALWPLRVVATHVATHGAHRRLVVELEPRQRLEPLLGELGEIRGLQIDDDNDRRTVTVQLAEPLALALVGRIGELDYVRAVRSIR